MRFCRRAVRSSTTSGSLRLRCRPARGAGGGGADAGGAAGPHSCGPRALPVQSVFICASGRCLQGTTSGGADAECARVTGCATGLLSGARAAAGGPASPSPALSPDRRSPAPARNARARAPACWRCAARPTPRSWAAMRSRPSWAAMLLRQPGRPRVRARQCALPSCRTCAQQRARLQTGHRWPHVTRRDTPAARKLRCKDTDRSALAVGSMLPEQGAMTHKATLAWSPAWRHLPHPHSHSIHQAK